MIYFQSDQHFYHHNILLFREHEAHQRPFRTTDEMHRFIIHRFNEVVSPEDITYHLGDFAYGPGAKSWQQVGAIVSKLNGKHHIIAGNHDHLDPFKYVEAGFQSFHTSLMLEDYLLIHDPAIAGCEKSLKVIHGHLHGLAKHIGPNTYSVCPEVNDYYPVAFDTIKEYFNET